MDRRKHQIQPLPPETVAQIKSSATIISLSGVVVELVKNSLDAGAAKINVSVDFRRGACSVADDGTGILEQEFIEGGGLGRLHHTSKLHSPPSRQHGHKGAFLSSLAAVSLLSITSRPRDEHAHNTITFHHTRPIVRLVPAADSHGTPSAGGTLVTVHDLFGNMPVRVKQRPNDEHDTIGKDWDDMTSKLTGVLLAWLGDVSLSAELKGSKRKWAVRSSRSLPKISPDDAATSSSFNFSRILTVLSNTGHILPPSFNSWIKASARTPLVSIEAAVSLHPAPTRNIQFISFGISPVESQDDINVLFEEVNRTFAASTFGAPDEPAVDDIEKARRLQDRRFKKYGVTNEQIRGGGKSVDRWPMFYVRIELERQDSNPLDDAEAAFDSSQSLQTILHLLNAMFVQFLQENNFRPHVSRSRRKIPTQGPAISSRDSTPAQNEPSTSRKDSPQALATDSSIRSPNSLPRNVGIDLPKPTHDSVCPSDMPRRSRHQAKEDFMNTTVRLPSFARSKKTSVGNGLDSWSRVKGGGKIILEDIYSGLPRSNKSIEAVKVVPQQTTTRSEVQEKHIALMKPGIGKARGSTPSQQAPRPSGSHQLETIFCTAESTESEKEDELFEETPPTTGADERNELADEIIPWKNPITQKTVLINARNGLVMQQASRPCSAGSLSSVQSPSRPPSTGSLESSIRRPRTSRSNSSLCLTPKPDSWIERLLRNWENPVFRQAEPRIHSLCQDDLQFPFQQDGNPRPRGSFQDMRDTFEATMPTFRGNLSRESLKQAEVIAQVDQKFILLTLAVENIAPETEKSYKKVLVLIDQHAADERCRIEKLFHEFCSPHSTDTSRMDNGRRESVLAPSTLLRKPIHFRLSHKELHLFEHNKQHLREWGVHYRISKNESNTSDHADRGHLLSVTALPSLVAERCRLEPKLLIDILRAEVWAREEGGKWTSTASITNRSEGASHNEKTTAPSRDMLLKESTQTGAHAGSTWLRHIGGCPQGIIDMLNSRSCRTAIMFNDVLSINECTNLVSRLAECAFPFQCAHGRPSMVPLVELGADELDSAPSLVSGVTRKSFGGNIAANDLSFGRAYRNWMSRGGSFGTG